MSNLENVVDTTVQASQALEEAVVTADADVAPSTVPDSEAVPVEQAPEATQNPEQPATEPVEAETEIPETKPDDAQESNPPPDAEQLQAVTNTEAANEIKPVEEPKPVEEEKAEETKPAEEKVEETKVEAPLTPKRLANIVASPAKRVKVTEP